MTCYCQIRDTMLRKNDPHENNSFSCILCGKFPSDTVNLIIY